MEVMCGSDMGQMIGLRIRKPKSATTYVFHMEGHMVSGPQNSNPRNHLLLSYIYLTKRIRSSIKGVLGM